MSRMAEILKSLAGVEAELQVLDGRRDALKQQAWASSGRTIGRARQLVAEATLSLLAQGDVIELTRLKAEMARLAGAGDRFAVDLCGDWLRAAEEAASMSRSAEIAENDVGPH